MVEARAAQLTLDDGATTELNEIELDLWFLILSIAGSETTRNAIAIGLKSLIEHPEQFERLRADPELMGTAVDEIMRWSSPVLYHRRTVVADTEVDDVPMEAGLPVAMFWPLANRDERMFPDPYRFDIARTPNDHVAFGGGRTALLPRGQPGQAGGRVMLTELLSRLDRHRARRLVRGRRGALVGAGSGGAGGDRSRPAADPVLVERLTVAKVHMRPLGPRADSTAAGCPWRAEQGARSVGGDGPGLRYVCSSHTGRFCASGHATSEWRNWQTR